MSNTTSLRIILLFSAAALGAGACSNGSGGGGTAGASGSAGASGTAGAGSAGVGSAGAGAAGAGAAGASGTVGTSGTAGATGAAGSGGAGVGSAGAGAAGSGSAGASGAAGQPGDGGAPDGAGDGATASTIKGHPTPGKAYPTYPGYTLYLVEEFDAPIDLDKDAYWTWGDGTILDGQARFVEEAISFEGGKMKITVSKGDTPAGLSVVKAGVAPGALVPARTLKSGEFRSKYNMYRFGRYEASIKAPAVDGNFILSFFSFRTPHFQEWREIDFELLANLPKSVSTNLIIGMNMESWSPTAEEPASTFPFGAQPAQALPATFARSDAFHTYAFEALPDRVTFFVDGVAIRTKVDKMGKNNLIVPERSMKVMFNHWVFGSNGFGGDPAKNTYPFTGEYDWFRFYKWDQDALYPCEPVPACLPAADKDLSANNPKEAP